VSGYGIDRETGKPLSGWSHVAQSMGVIFTTRFGERVMRRWFGSLVPNLLGETMVPETFVRFFAAVGAALEQEPRVRLIRVLPLSVNRNGRAELRIEVEYRPRGHLGDFTPAGRKRVAFDVDGGRFVPRETEDISE
jgi:Phage baseplate assembly protein W